MLVNTSLRICSRIAPSSQLGIFFCPSLKFVGYLGDLIESSSESPESLMAESHTGNAVSMRIGDEDRSVEPVDGLRYLSSCNNHVK